MPTISFQKQEHIMVDNPAHQGLSCPVCRVDLVMSDRQGIEIDYCPQCRGVWLDRGELDKIIERSLAGAPGGSPSGTRDDRYYGDERGHGHGSRGRHGRRSFLRDLFD
jgi:Zn-finger nucleic acid-binding protein